MKKKASRAAPRSTTQRRRPTPRRGDSDPAATNPPITLLSGGNPQIAMGYGDAPVQAYLAAMPEWKQDIGRRLDDLIAKAVPGVCKAVKWNSPFYGIEQGRWFVSFHCFTRSVKVTFFQGTLLVPMPPGTSRVKDVRYLDIKDGDAIDERQFIDWITQAAQLSGTRL